MGDKAMVVDKRGEVGLLILNRPETGNLLSEELCNEISQTLDELNENEGVRLILVKGAGDNFCKGGDVTQIVTFDKLGARNYFSGLIKMYQTFRRIDKPSIAMVHGYAAGGGLGVALSCDLIIAAADARFGATAVKTGLFCLNTTGVMLPPIVGSKKALEMGLTGDLISAREAKRLGIVNMVVSRERLETAAMQLAGKILKMNPVAIGTGRRNLYDCAYMDYDRALEHSAEVFSLLAVTEEAKEGMRAFLEKREPFYR